MRRHGTYSTTTANGPDQPPLVRPAASRHLRGFSGTVPVPGAAPGARPKGVCVCLAYACSGRRREAATKPIPPRTAPVPRREERSGRPAGLGQGLREVLHARSGRGLRAEDGDRRRGGRFTGGRRLGGRGFARGRRLGRRRLALGRTVEVQLAHVLVVQPDDRPDQRDRALVLAVGLLQGHRAVGAGLGQRGRVGSEGDLHRPVLADLDGAEGDRDRPGPGGRIGARDDDRPVVRAGLAGSHEGGGAGQRQCHSGDSAHGALGAGHDLLLAGGTCDSYDSPLRVWGRG